MKYLERFNVCLQNPSQDEMDLRDPLSTFSFYLSGRVNVLCHFSDEIIEELEQGFSQADVQFEHIARAESLMWLWLLGAYEVVRTMTQAETCFSQRVRDDLRQLKKPLSAARMPAAKMEKPGKKIPVTSNRSPSGWDAPNRDLLINDPEESDSISARWVLSEFDRVFSSIGKADILASHESAYRVRT
jgi:hypothetical protein